MNASTSSVALRLLPLPEVDNCDSDRVAGWDSLDLGGREIELSNMSEEISIDFPDSASLFCERFRGPSSFDSRDGVCVTCASLWSSLPEGSALKRS